jgi:ANTAR domain
MVAPLQSLRYNSAVSEASTSDPANSGGSPGSPGKPQLSVVPDPRPVQRMTTDPSPVVRSGTESVEARSTIEQLTEALGTRSVIGQAMGILMERYELDADDAFGYLRRASQATNTKLRLVAERLVSEKAKPTASDPDQVH